MNLASFQDAFSQAVQAQEPPTPDSVQAIPGIGQTPQAAQQVAVYRDRIKNNLVARLQAQFPTVYQIVGDEFLEQAALACFVKFPPRAANPLKLAQIFPDFLASYDAAAVFPYLVDVAMVDLGILRAFHAADAVSIKPDLFSQQSAETLIHKRVRLHPACYWLVSGYAIYDIWRLYNAKSPPTTIDHRVAQQIVIVRPKLKVEIYAIDGGFVKALDALDADATLEEAFLQGTLDDPRFDLGAAIRFLVHNGLLVELI